MKDLNERELRLVERRNALQALYSLSFQTQTGEAEIKRALAFIGIKNNDFQNMLALNLPTGDSAGFCPSDEPETMAWKLVQGVCENMGSLDKKIEKYSRNWRLSRLGRVELALLRLALYELVNSDAVPQELIQDAVTLAMDFELEDAAPLIKGILEAAARDKASAGIFPDFT